MVDVINHTNTVENFFSIFKRGVIGTCHHMSEAHLHRYTAKADGRNLQPARLAIVSAVTLPYRASPASA